MKIMKTKELTFDEAWEYIIFLIDKGFTISAIAKRIRTDRSTLSNAINNKSNSATGILVKLPERCKPLVIEFVKDLQLETWREKKKT